MSRDVGPAASTARYGVVGNPVDHSLSPQIHAAFARQADVALEYVRVPAPVDQFKATIAAFFSGGGLGLNVTLPFKLEAHGACDRLSSRATRAGAVNWLAMEDGQLVGDNTDGGGLVRDLERVLLPTGRTLAGSRVLMLGAGGAGRGVVGPLLDCDPRVLVIANRNASRAESLASTIASPIVQVRSFDAIDDEPFDVIVNATSASIAGESLPLRAAVLASAGLVYDMMYGAGPTCFLVDAQRAGATVTVDGLGMLVEQAAESFFLWRGVHPETAPVLASLRAAITKR